MKSLLKFFAICLPLAFFTSCSKAGGSTNTIIIGPTLEAAISSDENCTETINFEDFDNNVYAYRADAGFTVPTVQAGGHSTIDESTDLGFNLFIDPEASDRTNYAIRSSGIEIGTAYIFYKISGTEYISSGNGGGDIVVQWLDLDDDGKVLSLKATFNNVEIVIGGDPNTKRCINNFVITF